MRLRVAGELFRAASIYIMHNLCKGFYEWKIGFRFGMVFELSACGETGSSGLEILCGPSSGCT